MQTEWQTQDAFRAVELVESSIHKSSRLPPLTLDQLTAPGPVLVHVSLPHFKNTIPTQQIRTNSVSCSCSRSRPRPRARRSDMSSISSYLAVVGVAAGSVVSATFYCNEK